MVECLLWEQDVIGSNPIIPIDFFLSSVNLKSKLNNFQNFPKKMYCAREFTELQLTRDHIQPTSRGGADRWENVVAACRRCNQHKADRTPEEANMELVALPYRPNNAEYLALTNSRRILGDQMEFLRGQFSKNSRFL